jgi:hypothetical protein
MGLSKRPLAIGIAAAAAAALTAIAIGAGTATGIDAPRSVDLKVGRGHDTAVDVGKRGDSIGDGFITTGARLTDATGNAVGRADVVGTILSRAADALSISVRLADGELEVRGLISTSGKPAQLAIVGGTGAYSNARGDVRLIPNQQKLELRIEP